MKKRYWMPAAILAIWGSMFLIGSTAYAGIGLLFTMPFVCFLAAWNLYLMGRIEQLEVAQYCLKEQNDE